MTRRLSEPVQAVLLAAALAVVYLAFHELVTLVVILVVTVIIAIPLAVSADAFERRGIPRVIGALVALLLGLGVVGGVLALVVPTFIDQGARVIAAIPSTFDTVRDRISDATGTAPTEVGAKIQDYVQGYVNKPVRLIGPAAQVGLGIAGVIGTALVVLLTAFYIAVNPRALIDGVLSMFPARRRDDAARVLAEIRAAWMGWLRGVGIDMLVSGALLYIGLMLVNLDFALVFAVIGALFVVVPYVGAIAGGIPPVLFALADSPTKALIVLGVYLLVQQIEGNVIIPVVMSRQVALHPAVIIIGVVVVGRVVGFAGLVVAVPLISATLILVRALWVDPIAREDERRQTPFDASGDSSTSSPTRPVTSTLRP